MERQRERWARKPSIWTKDIQQDGRHYWLREQTTFHVQNHYPTKVLIVQRLWYDRF